MLALQASRVNSQERVVITKQKKTENAIKKGPSKSRRGAYQIQNDRMAINLKTEILVHPL